jgi:hypothetical protein
MSGANWLQLLALVAALAVATPLLGGYIASVFADPPDDGSPPRRPRRSTRRIGWPCPPPWTGTPLSAS